MNPSKPQLVSSKIGRYILHTQQKETAGTSSFLPPSMQGVISTRENPDQHMKSCLDHFSSQFFQYSSRTQQSLPPRFFFSNMLPQYQWREVIVLCMRDNKSMLDFWVQLIFFRSCYQAFRKVLLSCLADLKVNPNQINTRVWTEI